MTDYPLIERIKMLIALFPTFDKIRDLRELYFKKVSFAKSNQYWQMFFDIDEGQDFKFKFPGTEFTIGILFEDLRIDYKESK